MRSILVAFTMIAFCIVSIPLFLLMKLVGLVSRKLCVVCSQWLVTKVFALVLYEAGGQMTVLGRENIPKGEAVLFAGNHRSYADIPMIYCTCGKPVGFVAKKEIGKVPGLSWWMTNMNCLFLDRKDLRQSLKIILAAIENVKAGYSMCIMPEGTRNHNDEMLPFKEGSFKIAEKTGCKIVPVAIVNSDGLYELHRPSIRPAKLVIHYGTPIDVGAMSREEQKNLGAKVRDIVSAMYLEDKKLIEEK